MSTVYSPHRDFEMITAVMATVSSMNWGFDATTTSIVVCYSQGRSLRPAPLSAFGVGVVTFLPLAWVSEFISVVAETPLSPGAGCIAGT
jgi:hypothetical protein